MYLIQQVCRYNEVKTAIIVHEVNRMVPSNENICTWQRSCFYCWL